MLTDKHGESTTKPGQEQFERFMSVGRVFYQYEFRAADGDLFAVSRRTLAECREDRDSWVQARVSRRSKQLGYFRRIDACGHLSARHLDEYEELTGLLTGEEI